MSRLDYMMITASPEVAAFIEQHGVARIFMDQEVLGKAERQGHLDTHKVAHSLAKLRAAEAEWRKADSAALLANQQQLGRLAFQLGSQEAHI